MWDPYDRERRRRLMEQQRREQQHREAEARAHQMRAGQSPIPPALRARIEEEINNAHRERDEWAARYKGAMTQLEQQRDTLVSLRTALDEAQRERQRLEAQPPAVPQALLTRFEEELATAQRERDEWAERYDGALALLDEERTALAAEVEQQREQVRAEADAQRERLTRNAEQRAYEDNRKVLLNLLGVADNFGRALEQAGDDSSALAEGLRLTHRSFLQALTQAGVEPLSSLGEPFDPALHEAVGTRPSADDASGTVIAELQPGYRFRNALLRPARVIVAE